MINAFGAPIVGKYYDKHGNNIILIGLIVMLLSIQAQCYSLAAIVRVTG